MIPHEKQKIYMGLIPPEMVKSKLHKPSYPSSLSISDMSVRGTEVKEGTVATLTCTVRWASIAPETITWSVEGQGTYSSGNDTGSGHVVSTGYQG